MDTEHRTQQEALLASTSLGISAQMRCKHLNSTLESELINSSSPKLPTSYWKASFHWCYHPSASPTGPGGSPLHHHFPPSSKIVKVLRSLRYISPNSPFSAALIPTLNNDKTQLSSSSFPPSQIHSLHGSHILTKKPGYFSLFFKNLQRG